MSADLRPTAASLFIARERAPAFLAAACEALRASSSYFHRILPPQDDLSPKARKRREWVLRILLEVSESNRLAEIVADARERKPRSLEEVSAEKSRELGVGPFQLVRFDAGDLPEGSTLPRVRNLVPITREDEEILETIREAAVQAGLGEEGAAS